MRYTLKSYTVSKCKICNNQFVDVAETHSYPLKSYPNYCIDCTLRIRNGLLHRGISIIEDSMLILHD